MLYDGIFCFTVESLRGGSIPPPRTFQGGQKSKGKVIEIIAQNPSVTIPEIAAALDMSIPGIEKIIRALKKEDKLRRVGPDNDGHWEIA